MLSQREIEKILVLYECLTPAERCDLCDMADLWIGLRTSQKHSVIKPSLNVIDGLLSDDVGAIPRQDQHRTDQSLPRLVVCHLEQIK